MREQALIERIYDRTIFRALWWWRSCMRRPQALKSNAWATNQMYNEMLVQQQEEHEWYKVWGKWPTI